MKTIKREQIKDRLAAKAPMLLIEALPPKYFADAHLPGAINIPHDALHDKAPVLLPDKQAFIVVYCANTACRNSHIAAQTLEQLGYTNVYEYVEGKQDWLDAGYPVAAIA